MNQPIIETHHLTRKFGEITAVDDLSIEVSAGSVYGFLGPNGAGKTTTIYMLLGLAKPDRGTIRLIGHTKPAAALSRIGALVETPSVYPHLTGRENLEVTRRIINADRQQIDRVLDIVDLTAAANRLVKGYSLGMRQRLGLALALLNEPELLILDEPTNGLDPAGIREIRGLIRQLAAERGITIFLSSHLLAEVEQIATHIGIIQRGKLAFQGTLAELQAKRQPHIVLEIENPSDAATLLEAEGFKVGSNTNSTLTLGEATREKAAAANRLLVQAGITVYGFSVERQSLEDIFLMLTGDNAPVEVIGG